MIVELVGGPYDGKIVNIADTHNQVMVSVGSEPVPDDDTVVRCIMTVYQRGADGVFRHEPVNL